MTHIRKRIRKLSTAVFRGSHSEYNFDVYPITTAITDHPVVFIFSRRKVDKKGRGHHAVSCVGETQSIISEIKKHKRSKCVKGNEANVVCILKESDRTARSGVLNDIASVRAFSCVQGKFKPTIKAKLSSIKDAKTARILPFKPLVKNCRVGSAAINNGKPTAVIRKVDRSSAVKPTKATIEKSKRSVAKPAKKGRTAETRKRVQSGVDSDSGQYRLSKPKKPGARGAKTRIAGSSGTRSKLAA